MSRDTTTTAEILKPPLKWAGGKRWLVPHLKPIWEKHKHRRLVEPLCGGLAVTLSLMPGKALLNDINPHVINFYRWLKKGLIIETPMGNDKKLYYDYREEFNRLIAEGAANTKKAAELFYYLNRTGYNGLCRFNKSGGFNVPFGSYSFINYAQSFLQYSNLFAGWEFTSKDFADITLDPEDFIYADPPYDVPFTQYAAGGFSWDDQVRLAYWLSDHPGPVVLSNQATQRILDLYQSLGFILTVLDAPRMINCTGDRTPAKEVLAAKGMATSQKKGKQYVSASKTSSPGGEKKSDTYKEKYLKALIRQGKAGYTRESEKNSIIKTSGYDLYVAVDRYDLQRVDHYFYNMYL